MKRADQSRPRRPPSSKAKRGISVTWTRSNLNLITVIRSLLLIPSEPSDIAGTYDKVPHPSF